MAFLKPQNPMTKGSDYFYPLTTADQVIMDGGYRLNDIVGKVKKSTITLYANGWSAEAPYYYSVTVDGLSDKVNMKMLPQYPDDFEGKQAMKAETAKISFASRNDNILTFECWEEAPTIDIPVDIEIDITYPSKNAEVELNYSVVGGTTEPEEPMQNMIWVNTDVEITDHIISKNEPSNPVENMVWISAGDNSSVAFHTMKINNINVDEVCPLYAKQYINGAWVDVPAKSHLNGEWIDWWDGVLYNAGDDYSRITGGWEIVAMPWNSSVNYAKKHTLSKNATNMVAKTSEQGGSAIWPVNAIDLTGAKTLYAEVNADNTNTGGFRSLRVWKADAAYLHESGHSLAYVNLGTGTHTVSIDLSTGDYNGLYRVGFCLYSTGTNDLQTVTIKKVWLER